MIKLITIFSLFFFLPAYLAAPATQAANAGGSALPPGQSFTNEGDLSTSGQLASTTSYLISPGDQPTACGCSGMWQAPTGGTVLTAAASFPIYGDGYCGAGCGKCFELQNTGNPPCPDRNYQGCGGGGHKGEKVIVMITNACPQKGNEEWCTSPNRHGYKWHFDIAVPGNVPGLVGQNGWGNAEVRFIPIDCHVALNARGSQMAGNLLDNYKQCKCSSQRPVAGVAQLVVPSDVDTS